MHYSRDKLSHDISSKVLIKAFFVLILEKPLQNILALEEIHKEFDLFGSFCLSNRWNDARMRALAKYFGYMNLIHQEMKRLWVETNYIDSFDSDRILGEGIYTSNN